MASGSQLHVFKPRDAIFPSTNPGTLDSRNRRQMLEFDAATEESCYFEGVLNRLYAGGGLTCKLHWCASSATSGVTKWSIAVERIAVGQDLDVDDFAAVQTTTGSPDATDPNELVTSEIAFTAGAQMDSLAAGESFRIKLARVAADGADTMAGDAEVLALEIRET